MSTRICTTDTIRSIKSDEGIVNQFDRAIVDSSLAQWRRQLVLAKTWLAVTHKDAATATPRELLLGAIRAGENPDHIAFNACRKALEILLVLARRDQVRRPVAATTKLPQCTAANSWDRARAQVLQRIERQNDLERLCRAIELFTRLVAQGDYYCTTLSKTRAAVDALKMGKCRPGAHPTLECSRLKRIGRIDRQLLCDFAGAAYHLVPGSLLVSDWYRDRVEVERVLYSDLRLEIFNLLNELVIHVLGCSSGFKMDGPSRTRSMASLQSRLSHVPSLQFRIAVVVQYLGLSPRTATPSTPRFPSPCGKVVNGRMNFWSRVKANVIAGGYRHAAMMFAAAIPLNASLSIMAGGFMADDPIGDLRVALARPDLFLEDILVTSLPLHIFYCVHYASLFLLAVTGAAALGLLGGYYQRSRHCLDIFGIVSLVSTFAMAERVFCLVAWLVSLSIAVGKSPSAAAIFFMTLVTDANRTFEATILGLHIAFCIGSTCCLAALVILSIRNYRFGLPAMICVAAGSMWFAIRHRSIAYLALETANLFVAIGFGILGALVILEEFIRDPMRIEARACLSDLVRDAGTQAYRDSGRLAWRYRNGNLED